MKQFYFLISALIVASISGCDSKQDIEPVSELPEYTLTRVIRSPKPSTKLDSVARNYTSAELKMKLGKVYYVNIPDKEYLYLDIVAVNRRDSIRINLPTASLQRDWVGTYGFYGDACATCKAQWSHVYHPENTTNVQWILSGWFDVIGNLTITRYDVNRAISGHFSAKHYGLSSYKEVEVTGTFTNLPLPK